MNMEEKNGTDNCHRLIQDKENLIPPEKTKRLTLFEIGRGEGITRLFMLRQNGVQQED